MVKNGPKYITQECFLPFESDHFPPFGSKGLYARCVPNCAFLKTLPHRNFALSCFFAIFHNASNYVLSIFAQDSLLTYVTFLWTGPDLTCDVQLGFTHTNWGANKKNAGFVVKKSMNPSPFQLSWKTSTRYDTWNSSPAALLQAAERDQP